MFCFAYLKINILIDNSLLFISTMDSSISEIFTIFLYGILLVAAFACVNVLILFIVNRVVLLARNHIVRPIHESIRNNVSVQYVEPPKKLLDMMAIVNPFLLDIDIATASYHGIECNISSELDCYAIGLWGCSYNFLLELMTSGWINFHYYFSTGIQHEAVAGRFMSYSAAISLSANVPKRFVFELPQGIQVSDITQNETYGRRFYPLVVITFLKDAAFENDRIVVATAIAIHLPDPLNPAVPYIISQIVMQANGISGVLKDTFAASYEPHDIHAEPEHICSVCFDKQISIVILPCGHASMCQACFTLVDRCPICRRPIQSYFLL